MLRRHREQAGSLHKVSCDVLKYPLGCSKRVKRTSSRIHLPCSPTLNSSYASHVTTPPGSRLQHHFMTLQSTYRKEKHSRLAYPLPSPTKMVNNKVFTHHGRCQTQFLHQGFSTERVSSLRWRIKIVTNECTRCARVRTGTEWK